MSSWGLLGHLPGTKIGRSRERFTLRGIRPSKSIRLGWTSKSFRSPGLGVFRRPRWTHRSLHSCRWVFQASGPSVSSASGQVHRLHAPVLHDAGSARPLRPGSPQAHRPAVCRSLRTILNRHRASSFVIASNRALNGWLSVFDDAIFGHSATDRLAKATYRERMSPHRVLLGVKGGD